MAPQTRSGQRAYRIWLLALIILVGAAARIALLSGNRFHPDEALFATLSRRIITGSDPLLANTSLLVDKPPLFYYLLAAGVSMCWACEATARLPGLFASLITLALVARLAWQLWRSEVSAVLAAVFCALSPFAILFAPTAFTDPQLTMWLLAALVAVCAGRWGWGGVLTGLALATKQNALFFLPLVIGLGAIRRIDAETGWHDAGRWALRFTLGLGAVVALMLAWDAARHAGSGFWAAGFGVNNPGRLIRSNEVWPRALGWLGWLRYFTGSIPLSLALLALLLTLAPFEIATRPRTRGAAVTLVLLSFLVGYLAFLWLVAFPLFDRYLLPLVPLCGLLVGRAGALLTGWLGERHHHPPGWAAWAAAAILAAALVSPACRAAQGSYPVGGDHGAYDGIDQVADYLRTLPEGTVVYNQSLGWLLDYYLFNAYVYPAPFDTPAALAADLETFGQTPALRYLVLSRRDSPTEVLFAIEQAGFSAHPVLETTDRFGRRSFTVYRLERLLEARKS